MHTSSKFWISPSANFAVMPLFLPEISFQEVGYHVSLHIHWLDRGFHTGSVNDRPDRRLTEYLSKPKGIRTRLSDLSVWVAIPYTTQHIKKGERWKITRQKDKRRGRKRKCKRKREAGLEKRNWKRKKTSNIMLVVVGQITERYNNKN